MTDDNKGMLFPGPLPEPVALHDLNARFMLLIGYVTATLTSDRGNTEFQCRQDRLAAEALWWCVPYLRALIEMAAAHEPEFRSRCPSPLEDGNPPHHRY